MKLITLLTFLLTASAIAETEKDNPVHLFVLSGQSNMAGMDPETGFMKEAKKLFKDEKVVYIKVAKGGQPICRWLEEWQDIAKKNGLGEKDIKRIHKGGEVKFYQPILDQYKEMLEKYPKFASVTFCWMQGERDANENEADNHKEAGNLEQDLLKVPNLVDGGYHRRCLAHESVAAVVKNYSLGFALRHGRTHLRYAANLHGDRERLARQRRLVDFELPWLAIFVIRNENYFAVSRYARATFERYTITGNQ